MEQNYTTSLISLFTDPYLIGGKENLKTENMWSREWNAFIAGVDY